MWLNKVNITSLQRQLFSLINCAHFRKWDNACSHAHWLFIWHLVPCCVHFTPLGWFMWAFFVLALSCNTKTTIWISEIQTKKPTRITPFSSRYTYSRKWGDVSSCACKLFNCRLTPCSLTEMGWITSDIPDMCFQCHHGYDYCLWACIVEMFWAVATW